MRIAFAGALLALLAPAVAFAHGSIAPTAAVPGTAQRFVVTVQNTLQGGPDVVGVTVTMPEGVAVESAEANQPRWTATVSGSTIEWQGGPVEGLAEDFVFSARMPGAEGVATFQAQERYARGAGPPFPLAVTVSSSAAPSGESATAAAADDDLAWIAIAVAGTALLLALGAVIAAGALWLRRREPRS